jgi:hypothetical protein
MGVVDTWAVSITKDRDIVSKTKKRGFDFIGKDRDIDNLSWFD